MALKFEDKFVPGDYIRAYDFKPMQGRDDCYIEGVVIRTKYEMCYFYVVCCEKDVFGGKESKARNGLEILVPMEISRDFDHRIFKL